MIQRSDLLALTQLAEQHLTPPVSEPVSLKGDGSDRKIFRFYGGEGQSCAGVTSPDRAENEAFLFLSRHFAQCGIPVPAIYSQNLEQGCYLLEDLGNLTLADQLDHWNLSLAEDRKAILAAYQKVLAWLPKIQIDGNHGLDYSFCPTERQLDHHAFSKDIHYFETYFWNRLTPETPHTLALQLELDRLIVRVASVQRNAFVYRDFQSRNIMWKNNEPYFIDYQSGCHGALHYDLAAVLYASRSGLDDELRHELILFYLQKLAQWMNVNPEQFMEDFYHFVLIRRLRSLGTYGHLSLEKGKFYFLEAIPKTLKEIHGLLEHQPALRSWTTLRTLFQQWTQNPNLCSVPWLQEVANNSGSSSVLK
ncbi:phosphotransferase [Deltaproteobacteria bacterium TL4]